MGERRQYAVSAWCSAEGHTPCSWSRCGCECHAPSALPSPLSSPASAVPRDGRGQGGADQPPNPAPASIASPLTPTVLGAGAGAIDGRAAPTGQVAPAEPIGPRRLTDETRTAADRTAATGGPVALPTSSQNETTPGVWTDVARSGR